MESGVNVEKVIKQIEQLPKTELHIHAEACVRFESYLKLNKKYAIDSKLKTVKDFKVLLDISSLADMISNFIYLQQYFKQPEDYSYMVDDIVLYCKQSNISYIETHFSLTMPKKNNLNVADILFTLTGLLAEAEKKHGIVINLIIDISRGFGFANAKENFDLMRRHIDKHGNNHIAAMGMGGLESKYPGHIYADVFTAAVDLGYPVVCHAGEEADSRNIWDAILLLRVNRIGHGTSAMFDNDLIKYLVEHKVPLEVCPASNCITRKYVTTYEEHPIKRFFDAGIVVTINTDDPVLFNVTLNDELIRLNKYCQFSIRDLVKLLEFNIESSFATKKQKETYRKSLATAARNLQIV